MTKRMLWYVCLGLLCCSALLLTANAAGTRNDATRLKAAQRALSVLHSTGTHALTVEKQQSATGAVLVRSGRGQAVTSKAMRGEPAITPEMKQRLNEEYARDPRNQRPANPLDQGMDGCPGTPIAALPFTDTGTTAGMVNDIDPTACFSTSPDVIYNYTPGAPENVTVSLCGSLYDTVVHVRTGGACPGTTEVICNDDFCGLQSQVSFDAAAGTTYYIVVDGFSTASGDYTLNVTSAPIVPCTPDFVVTAPVSQTANTCGAGDDCDIIIGAEDQIWEVTIPTDGMWMFSLCDDNAIFWDSYLAIGTTCCSSDVWTQDDGCSGANVFLSRTPLLTLTAGTYWVTVEGLFSGECGEYIMDISSPPPCDITCQAGDVIEVTEDFADPNFYLTDPDGGCNNTIPTYQNISCGETVCGVTETYSSPLGDTRDTDWYLFTVALPTTVTWTVTSEALVFGYILDITDCLNPFILGTIAQNTFPCDNPSAVATLNPGTYAAWVGPQAFFGVPPSQYRATLTGACSCDPVTDLTVIRGPGLADAAHLRWTATQASGLYRIFGTVVKNNDGDPNNGTDPEWSLVAELPAPAVPGVMTYTDSPLVPGPSPANFKSYAVVHDCAPRGRCCYGNPQSPSCASPVTEEACTGLAGTWMAGLNCTDNPCPPAAVNDECATAMVITNGVPITLDYSTANPQFNAGTEPLSCQTVYATLWFQYTAAASNLVTVTTCGGSTNFDTVVEVFGGSCGGASVGCNDDDFTCSTMPDGYYPSTVSFTAGGGTTYYIVVGAWYSSTNPATMGTLTVTE